MTTNKRHRVSIKNTERIARRLRVDGLAIWKKAYQTEDIAVEGSGKREAGKKSRKKGSCFTSSTLHGRTDSHARNGCVLYAYEKEEHLCTEL